jgi:hypothetical protein
MVEQSAKLCEPKSCQFLHRRRLTCHAELADVDARSQAKAFLTFWFVAYVVVVNDGLNSIELSHETFRSTPFCINYFHPGGLSCLCPARLSNDGKRWWSL